jgi:hypothetical protein
MFLVVIAKRKVGSAKKRCKRTLWFMLQDGLDSRNDQRQNRNKIIRLRMIDAIGTPSHNQIGIKVINVISTKGLRSMRLDV